MKSLAHSALLACSFVAAAQGAVVPRTLGPVLVTLGGLTFINKGLVAVGTISAQLRDTLGETIGGIGSAIALEPGTFTKQSGTYSGTLITQPDRGHNTEGTIDYRARRQYFDFTFAPYYGTGKLPFDVGTKTLKLTYRRTALTFDRKRGRTTGLDALGVRPQTPGYPQNPFADPPIPIANATYNHLTIDAEGLVINKDGSYFVSDEYGPYIYRFRRDGTLLSTIQPPEALVPLIGGSLNFTSAINPDTGRTPNQGFEGLTISPNGRYLYAMLQSATIQDGGSSKSTNRYTRLFKYVVSGNSRPKLEGEWIVPLPQTSKGTTLAQSEIHYLNKNQFLVLSRDGNGHGGDSTQSSYKQADLFDISKATDIHGSKFDGLTPVAPKGVLDPSITPAAYASFVNYLDPDQLGRFGLQNGGAKDKTLISAKWESFALAPVLDRSFPNDYFLFTMTDNDFITINGSAAGVPYVDPYGQDVDTQAFVFRVTLPNVEKFNV
ncbi:esterase-like activity of phytase-domain-containing protein [Cantharellus anzutake]|uniref:esterase-like activity of phytase-domain-containing protein n=1 Tax=Cantharellus anzutake TaxID=1750568 RepID=UPI0019060AF8|nr:esterase-like activity of phytase-domain-containing protein [Cantharellus anzutake]KAF8326354.1 esterase-like activity of phytase-domain-containing protein [Cantharellus anzutake]